MALNKESERGVKFGLSSFKCFCAGGLVIVSNSFPHTSRSVIKLKRKRKKNCVESHDISFVKTNSMIHVLRHRLGTFLNKFCGVVATSIDLCLSWNAYDN